MRLLPRHGGARLIGRRGRRLGLRPLRVRALSGGGRLTALVLGFELGGCGLSSLLCQCLCRYGEPRLSLVSVIMTSNWQQQQ